LCELAEVENGHAHRWFDTFAVELLISGVPIEQVRILLGHQTIKVTEKHSSPWVKARQGQLEAAVHQTFLIRTKSRTVDFMSSRGRINTGDLMVEAGGVGIFTVVENT
jgi:hypothetical protein